MIKSNNITYSHHDTSLVIKCNPQQGRAVAEKFKGKKVIVEFKEDKGLRSLDANARCWATCNEIAKVLGTTDKEVYRKVIREGTAFWLRPVQNDRIQEHKEKFEAIGIGWQAVPHIPCKMDGWTYIKEYYGTRIYNTKEMSDLINSLNQECEALDIPIIPPKEVRALLESWNDRG